MSSDAYIGVGASLLTPTCSDYNIPCEITLDILNKSNGIVGKIILYYIFIENEVEIPKPDVLIPKYAHITAGFVLNITSISLLNLVNTELLGAQDPYVVLTHTGTPAFSYKSSTKSGSNPLWEGVDCKLQLASIKQVVEDVIEVAVYDDNSIRSDTLVGDAGYHSLTHSLIHSLLLTRLLTHSLTHSRP